jgi:hypothetical protein
MADLHVANTNSLLWICLLLFLFVALPTLVYADPWGSKSLGDAVGYFLLVAAVVFYSVILFFTVLLSTRSKFADFMAYGSLPVYLLLVIKSIDHFLDYPKDWQNIVRGTKKAESPWIVFYGFCLLGLVSTLYYVLYARRKHAPPINSTQT